MISLQGPQHSVLSSPPFTADSHDLLRSQRTWVTGLGSQARAQSLLKGPQPTHPVNFLQLNVGTQLS